MSIENLLSKQRRNLKKLTIDIMNLDNQIYISKWQIKGRYVVKSTRFVICTLNDDRLKGENESDLIDYTTFKYEIKHVKTFKKHAIW